MAPGRYRVDTERRGTQLRVRISGDSRDVQSTIAAWLGIAAQVQQQRPGTMLVVSEVRGEPLTVPQVAGFLDYMRGLGFEGIRIAYVYPPSVKWPRAELAEILGGERGFDVRIFDNERDAEIWLRHGLSADDVDDAAVAPPTLHRRPPPAPPRPPTRA